MNLILYKQLFILRSIFVFVTMNSSLPINSILLEVLTKLDYTLEPPGFIGDGRTKQIMKNTLSKAIDAIGEESANAQGLKRVITTVEKLQDSPTHVLYVLKDPNGHYGEGEVIGILKVGKKHLYLYDELDSVHECEPLCVLDFFVKPERQRSGYGKFMFDYMLNDLKVDVNELAIDGPSPKMILFLQRNYGLDHMMRQTNNFAISTGFFANGSQNGGKKLNRKESPQATFGRYGARRPHSTVASVIHGENSHFESNPNYMLERRAMNTH